MNGPDLRAEPDGRLHLMAGTYGRLTAEAPRYAGKELRFVRVAARDMGLAAVRHAAEVKAALERGDTEAAARHAAREQSAREMEGRARAQEARLAPAVDAYHEWDEATKAQQRLAIAAHAELQRRHPDAQLPPLRSAEAPAPGEAERRELLWPQVDPEGNVTPEKPAEQETGKSPDLAAALRLARAGERDGSAGRSRTPASSTRHRSGSRTWRPAPGRRGRRPRSGRPRWCRTRTPIRATSAPHGPGWPSGNGTPSCSPPGRRSRPRPRSPSVPRAGRWPRGRRP